MTTSRIVRGTKGRIFVYICAILIVTGIIACYNSTRVELENVQKSNDLCHQQQENLSTQLQVISEYKHRLEKALKTEKAEHQQAKTELESRVNEEKLKHQKAIDEATLKFNSQQQHYNLLQAQHEDFKEECSNKQKEQLNIINNLQAKLKEVEGQVKQAEKEKENSVEHLKSQIEQLKAEKINLENQAKDILKREAEKQSIKLKNLNNQEQNQDTLQAPSVSETGSTKPNYAKQISVDASDYKIAANVGELPPSIADEQANENQAENVGKPEQSDQIVLPPPNKLQSSTPNSNIKSSKASLEPAPPLKVPTMTPETIKNKISQRINGNNNPEPIPSPSRKLPDGVVAVQNIPEEEEKNSKVENEPETNLVNNRYRNVAEDEKEAMVKEKVVNMQDKENNANEIFDVEFNDDPNINIGDKHEEEHKNRIDADFDQFQQNVDENDDGDDADDYVNPNVQGQPAIRN